jgi:prolyl oligopeptidase
MTIDYPPVRRDDTSSVLHGVSVADPYRYLEDPDSDRTRAFVTAQNALSQPYLAELPARQGMLDLTTALLTAPRQGVPWERGGRYFVIANPGELDQDLLYTADSLDELLESPRLLVDPNSLSDDGTVAMTAARVSPGGDYLAYALAEAGSDWRTIHVLDVGSGTQVSDELGWTKWIDPTWLPDESGFLYWRYEEPAGQEFTEATDAGELMLHRLVEPVVEDEVVWARPRDREWMAEPWVAADGRWLVLTTSPGTDSRSTIEAYRLVVDDDGTCQIDDDAVIVVGELADAHSVVASVGDTLFLRTERDAPRGKLVAVDLTAPGQPWIDVVGQHAADVLVDARPAAGAFALLWSTDAAHRIEIVGPAGDHRGWPDLPAPISVTALNTRQQSSEIFVGVTSFTRRARSYRIDIGEPGLPAVPLPANGQEIERTARRFP